MALRHPRLIFGGASIGDDYTKPQEVKDLLQTLKSLDISEIDTAALYPPTDIGASERLLGEAGAADQAFAIDTKVLVLGVDGNGTLEPAKIDVSMQTSHERLQLQTQKLNIIHCHAPDFTTPLKDQAAAFDAQYKEGRFRKLGVCNWPLDMLTELVEICEREGYVKPSVYQGIYNLVNRGHEQLFPTLRKHGIVFDAHSPLAGGFLSGKFTAGDVEGTRFAKQNIIGAFLKAQYDKTELHDAIRSLSKTLEPFNISKVDAALRWVCYHSALGPNDGVILGASGPGQLVQNVEGIKKGPLPDEVVLAIDIIWQTISGQ